MTKSESHMFTVNDLHKLSALINSCFSTLIQKLSITFLLAENKLLIQLLLMTELKSHMFVINDLQAQFNAAIS